MAFIKGYYYEVTDENTYLDRRKDCPKNFNFRVSSVIIHFSLRSRNISRVYILTAGFTPQLNLNVLMTQFCCNGYITIVILVMLQ